MQIKSNMKAYVYEIVILSPSLILKNQFFNILDILEGNNDPEIKLLRAHLLGLVAQKVSCWTCLKFWIVIESIIWCLAFSLNCLMHKITIENLA